MQDHGDQQDHGDRAAPRGGRPAHGHGHGHGLRGARGRGAAADHRRRRGGHRDRRRHQQRHHRRRDVTLLRLLGVRVCVPNDLDVSGLFDG